MTAFLLLLLVGHHALTRPTLVAAPPGWPIRRHPRIAHLMPYRFSDSLTANRVAARLRFRFIDKNGQRDRNHIVWIVHWSLIRKNRGLRWIATGEHDSQGREIRRRLTREELNSRIQHHPTAWVARLRYRRYGGGRLHTAETHMASCAARGLTMCLDGKGTVDTAEAADYVSGAAERTGVRLVSMTLQDLPGWRQRLDLFLDRQIACALLPRGPRPADWDRWRARGVQRWGRWR